VPPPVAVMPYSAPQSRVLVPLPMLRLAAPVFGAEVLIKIGLDDEPVKVIASVTVVVVVAGRSRLVPATRDRDEKVFAPVMIIAPREVPRACVEGGHISCDGSGCAAGTARRRSPMGRRGIIPRSRAAYPKSVSHFVVSVDVDLSGNAQRLIVQYQSRSVTCFSSATRGVFLSRNRTSDSTPAVEAAAPDPVLALTAGLPTSIWREQRRIDRFKASA
jgi:hypothetical protein